MLSAIETTLIAGKRFKIDVSLCGDLAANPLATFPLIGYGLERFSMAASSIDMIRHIIRNTPYEDCKELARELSVLNTAQEIRVYIRDFVITRINDGRWPGLASNERFKNVLISVLQREGGGN